MSWIASGTAAVSLGTQGYQMYKASQQEKEGRKAMNRLIEPTYEIPQEVYDQISTDEARALEGLPTEQKREYVRNLERSQQQALKTSADRRGGLINAQNLANQQVDAYSNLMTKDALARQQNQANLKQSKQALAQQKLAKKQFEENRYQAGLESAQAMMGAGIQGQDAALGNMASTLMQTGASVGSSIALENASKG